MPPCSGSGRGRGSMPATHLLVRQHVPDSVAGNYQKLVPLFQRKRLNVWRGHHLQNGGGGGIGRGCRQGTERGCRARRRGTARAARASRALLSPPARPPTTSTARTHTRLHPASTVCSVCGTPAMRFTRPRAHLSQRHRGKPPPLPLPTICSVCGRSALRLKSRSPMVRDTFSAPLMRLSRTNPPACRSRGTAPESRGRLGLRDGQASIEHGPGLVVPHKPAKTEQKQSGLEQIPRLRSTSCCSTLMMRLASSNRMGLWSRVSARATPFLDSTARESPAQGLAAGSNAWSAATQGEGGEVGAPRLKGQHGPRAACRCSTAGGAGGAVAVRGDVWSGAAPPRAW